MTDKLYKPTKGSIKQVSDGEFDKKSKGLFLIQLVYLWRELPVIAILPDVEVQQEPEERIIIPPTVIPDEEILATKDIDLGWCNSIRDTILSLSSEEKSNIISEMITDFNALKEYVSLTLTIEKQNALLPCRSPAE